MKQWTVIDFFCGAGGFSEGFRQQGFAIVKGVDNWQPAIDTFNANFGLECNAKNILDFKDSIEEIELLPDTDIILGSPPCVSFSSSNISGKADKSDGILLTQIFLRIVAVKKWKKNSSLKAWFMENVPSSIKHLASEYTFDDLGLGDWAKRNKIGRSKVAIQLEGNQPIINSADYGSAQSRRRVISGEIVKRKALVIPEQTHFSDPIDDESEWRKLKDVKKKLPRPNCNRSSRKVIDPNYSDLSLSLLRLTDHFYDTGLYECVWKQSKFLKVNHPYMGKMSFPENENNPSRTVVATKIGSSREAIIYRSEYNRIGDGEYRTPTVREAACIMGFPITYQFFGGEGTKWRLVGNAVSPFVSSAFALQVRKEYGLGENKEIVLNNEVRTHNLNDLNCFKERKFDSPPHRTKNSRFRRHPFKDGNITVTLSNYDIETNEKDVSEWIVSTQYGNGEGFPTYKFSNAIKDELERIIKTQPRGKDFLQIINNGFSERVANASSLQKMYEQQASLNGFEEPTQLVETIANIINDLGVDSFMYKQEEIIIFKNKSVVPLKQLYALYALCKITSIANH